jgi:hypothetical protein
MAHDVFVSHSAKDKTVADALVAKLESEGVRCWVAPRDVIPGSDWGESIIDAIESSRIMILIFSANANNSPQIKREIERAIHRGVYTIPFRIEDIQPTKSLEYFISTAHWLDAFSLPLGQHLESLTKTIKAILSTQPAPAVSDVVAAPLADIPLRPPELKPAQEEVALSRVPSPQAPPEHSPAPTEAQPIEQAHVTGSVSPPPLPPVPGIERETEISPGAPPRRLSREKAIALGVMALALLGALVLIYFTQPGLLPGTSKSLRKTAEQSPTGALPAVSRTFQIPDAKRVMSVTVPGSWKAEKTENSIDCESPDKLFLMRFEIVLGDTSSSTAPKHLQKNLAWLKKARNVNVDEKKAEVELKIVMAMDDVNKFVAPEGDDGSRPKTGEFAWRSISLDDDPRTQTRDPAAQYGFMFADAGNGSVVIAHYWLATSAKDSPHGGEAAEITDSVKKIDG